MRQLLIPKYERFDFNQSLETLNNKNVNQLIDDVSKLFSDYLENLHLFARSKSALMGPVGKILEQAKVKGLDSEFLKGYGISTHKNTLKIPLQSNILKPFEEGIDLLSKLLNHVPRHMRPKVIEIITYKIYYRREKANVEFWETWRRDLTTFLENKFHKNIDELKKECKITNKTDITQFSDILRISRKEREKNEKIQSLLDEFHSTRRETIIEEEVEE